MEASTVGVCILQHHASKRLTQALHAAGNARENYALALIERGDRDGNAHLGELPSDSERCCRGRLRHG
jgi:hypothetical protein